MPVKAEDFDTDVIFAVVFPLTRVIDNVQAPQDTNNNVCAVEGCRGVEAHPETVVFIPLSIAWFGATEIQKIAFLFIVYFVALLPLVIKTVADVPAAYLDVAVTKGASQWQLVRHVLFPVAKADIWDHLRGAYGVGWTWIILAEVWANAENGLGYLLEISYRRGRMDRYFAVVVVIVAIAVAFDQLWRIGSRLLFPYRYVD